MHSARGSFLGNQNKICEEEGTYVVNKFKYVAMSMSNSQSKNKEQRRKIVGHLVLL